MQAEFYKFSKRKNSTAVPTGSGLEVELTLKNGTSILQPTFLLSADISEYNYCHFNDRYYWINDITSVRNGLWEVQCRVDVLASWKSEILETSAFVQYSSSDNDQNITDSRNAVKIDKHVAYAVATSETGLFSPVWQSQGGIFVLGTMGALNSEVVTQSFCGLYVLDGGQLTEVAKILNSEEVLQQLINFFMNPTDTVVFCRWFPVGFNVVGVNTANVTFGIYETNINATILTKNYGTDILDIEIPWETEDFRRVEPFTGANLYMPGVGSVSLNLASISNCTGISLHATVDYVNNSVHYGVFGLGSGGELIGMYTGSLGADIPVASVQGKDMGGVLSSIGGIVSGALLLGTAGIGDDLPALASAFAIGGGVAKGIAASNTQVVKSSGSFGGGYGIYSGQGILPTLTMTRSLSIQEPSEYNDFMGNPCMKYRQISGLSGYCQTSGFQVSGEMLDSEKTEINNMMNGGVYIE